MKVFELKRVKATGKFKDSADKKFHNMCFVFKYINLLKISCEIGHILRMCRTVETPERNRLPARSGHKHRKIIVKLVLRR